MNCSTTVFLGKKHRCVMPASETQVRNQALSCVSFTTLDKEFIYLPQLYGSRLQSGNNGFLAFILNIVRIFCRHIYRTFRNTGSWL